jgi:hypothetical protein
MGSEVIDRTRLRFFTRCVRLVATGACLTLLLGACQQPREKSGTAIDKMATVHQAQVGATSKVRPAWQEAWLKFKRENDTDVANNKRRIIELRENVGKANARFRASYNVRIDELERRNNELRDRIDNYKDQGEAKWVGFKLGSKRDMDGLKSLLKKTTIKNG